jgi:hypothetical protein
MSLITDLVYDKDNNVVPSSDLDARSVSTAEIEPGTYSHIDVVPVFAARRPIIRGDLHYDPKNPSEEFTILEREWRTLLSKVIEQCNEYMECEHCGCPPDHSEVKDGIVKIGYHHMDAETKAYWYAIKDCDWSSKRELMERPDEWLEAMTPKLQFVRIIS